jgi:beta-galactosidase
VEFSTPVPLPPNLPGLAATVARVESLPPDVPVPLAAGGNFLHWREKLETSATVVEATEDGFPALIAAGGLHYLAGWPDEAALDRILTAACHRAGIETDPLPEGLRRRDSATHRFWFNYNPVPVEWAGITIPPAGVHWAMLKQ